LSSASPHIACPVADRRTHAVVDERRKTALEAAS
jgi:hypothetical protein